MAQFTPLSLVLLSLLVGPSTGWSAERLVQRSYPVQPGCRLSIETYRGSIAVEESDVAEIRIAVRLDSARASEQEANQAFDRLKLEWKVENNHVSAIARRPGSGRVRFVWNEDEPVELSWQISVPRQCSLNLATGNGGIVVGVLAGEMKARTESGTIFFRGIEGSIDAASGNGEVVVSRCSGDVVLTARRGNIRTGTVRGRAELKAINGDIDIQSAEGGLVASAEAGEISAGFPRVFSGNANITTAGGGILVKLDPKSDCLVKASSVWGRVESTLPLAIEPGGSGKNKLSGRLNRGGPLLTLHANGGHVKIEPQEELPPLER